MRVCRALFPAAISLLLVPTLLIGQEPASPTPEVQPEPFVTDEEFAKLKLPPFGPRVPNRRRDGARLRSVVAPVLSGITVDGDLGDWPETMERHPIDSLQVLPPYYGWNGLQGVDLHQNPDLSASFMVGYDPIRNLIHLAVIVRDDFHVIGNIDFWDTDAVEVFVDGRHSEDTASRFDGKEGVNIRAQDLAVLQYIGIAGEGPIYGVTRAAGKPQGPINPILMFGDIGKSMTRMEYRRERGVTTYEWAIEAFDRFPDKPTELVPGKKIGFDVGVADKDVRATTKAPQDEPVEDRVAWVSWWPGFYGPRYFNAADMGEIILGPRFDQDDKPEAPDPARSDKKAGKRPAENSCPVANLPIVGEVGVL